MWFKTKKVEEDKENNKPARELVYSFKDDKEVMKLLVRIQTYNYKYDEKLPNYNYLSSKVRHLTETDGLSTYMLGIADTLPNGDKLRKASLMLKDLGDLIYSRIEIEEKEI